MKYLLIILMGGMLLIGGSVFAQQEPLNTMYMYNGIAVNPAYAGTRDALSVTALHRQQWVSMKGSPRTSSIAIHSPIKLTNLSVGASVISDDTWVVNDFYANLFVAYKVKLSQSLRLSLGINFGLYDYNAGLSGLQHYGDATDQYLGDYDELVPNGGTGLYLYSDKFYVGLASPKLFESDLSDLRKDATELKRHYYLAAGYVFHITNSFALKPSILSKYVPGAPWTQDFNLQAFYGERFSVGASYRIENTIAFMAGYHIARKWMIGYAYGLATSDLGSYNDGSHEIILTLDLRLNRSIVQTPRHYF